MTTEELIESYQTAMDEIEMAEADNRDFDEWAIKAANAAAELKGRTVVAEVKWHNGRVTAMTGEVTSLVRDKVYMEVFCGPVEGDAMSMVSGDLSEDC